MPRKMTNREAREMSYGKEGLKQHERALKKTKAAAMRRMKPPIVKDVSELRRKRGK